jgi:hypothetical protein
VTDDWPEGTVIGYDSWHFHRWLFQRYFGFVLPPGAYSDILRQIRDRRAIRMERDKAAGMSTWAVRVHRRGKGNIWLLVVWKRRDNRLITAVSMTAERLGRIRALIPPTIKALPAVPGGHRHQGKTCGRREASPQTGNIG